MFSPASHQLEVIEKPEKKVVVMEEAVETKPTAENTENTRVFPVDFERRESQVGGWRNGGDRNISQPRKKIENKNNDS